MSTNGDLVPVVALGGVIGALARWGIDNAIPRTSPTQWPWSTLLINITGSLILGLLIATLLLRLPAARGETSRLARWSRPFLITGILGGFTTFSTFALQVRDLLANGNIGSGALYAVTSVIGGVLAVAGGSALARRSIGGASIDPGDVTDAVDSA